MALRRKPVVGEVLMSVPGSREYVVSGFREDMPDICLYERTGGSLDPLDHCFIWQFSEGLNRQISHTGRMKDGTEAPP